MKNARELPLIILCALATVLTAGGLSTARADTSGSDSAGPGSNSTVTIGGENFSVDPRGGSLNYGYTFFKGNVNYGQTPFNLALQYQQNATASYVGAFTDSDQHTHPYGVSAYLPTPEPKSTEQGGSQLDDAGAVWDLNLPVVFISTSKVSKYYGSHKIVATVSLGDSSFQYLMAMPSTNQSNYVNDYANALLTAGQTSPPLYSVDGRLLTFSNNAQAGQILVQDKYGTNYLFGAPVLYGYKGVNVYDPTYNSSNNADADQTLVYRIMSIFYANGQTLNFTYTDNSWTAPQQHTVTIGDTIGNTIATLNWNGTTGTVSIANQQGNLAPTHQLNTSVGDYRIKSIQDITASRSISFTYLVNQAVPYAWQNQTALASITNNHTGYQTQITYQQFNSNRAYDAGCTQFSLGQIAVKTVTNNYDQGTWLVSSAHYDFGFSNTSGPNFIMPQASGKKTYASGLNHWLDNFFYLNQDSDDCSSSDRVAAVNQTYGTRISTQYPDDRRNQVQTMTYDALGRTTQENVQDIFGHSMTGTFYTYDYSPSDLQQPICTSQSCRKATFNDLEVAYGSPQITESRVNVCTLNGVVLDGTDNFCFLNQVQQYIYDAAGNPTQEQSPLGQLTEYTYLPASQTNPPNERLVQTVKTHSIGNNGASYVLETQSFQNFAIAPTNGGHFLAQATLPVSNVETRFDAGTNSSYAYRTDTMGGYIGGNNYGDNDYSGSVNVGLNGILTQRGQQDNTGVSDVASLLTQYTASFTSLNQQTVLNVGSTVTGTAKGGGTATQNRGSSLISFMGYPLQQTNGLGQKTTQTYDNLGRITSVTTLAGTSSAQTTSYGYDLPADLALNANAAYSQRKTDPDGNVTVQVFDARQRHIATYTTLNGSSQVQTASYGYDNANNLTSGTLYGQGYQKTEHYYYPWGTRLLVATVPNYGLAQGRILDGINGITLEFRYQPASTSPTVIGKIYGPVKITQASNTSQLVLADGLIDADAANAALAGFELANVASNIPLGSLAGNVWATSGKAPQPLVALYQAIANLPQNAVTAASDKLLEYNSYGYDEWNRRVSTTHYTFINAGSAASAAPLLSKTVTSRAFNTGQRSITVTFPQGQQETSTYNLVDGLQSATLKANGVTTALGSFAHDGLGRIVGYTDSLNQAHSTAAYTPSGLLSSRTDAYGNLTNYTYDSVTFKLTQSILTPVAGGSIVVNRKYDSHLRPIQASDSQGNVYQWSYSASGLLAGKSLTLGGVNPGNPFQYAYSYDSYGDLTHVADPFLPFPQTGSGSTCEMVQNNASSNGYNITRDSFGRVSQLMAGSFHGINRNLSYDAATGLLTGDTLANLPAAFGCGDTGGLSVATAYLYDDNLRAVGKTVTRSDLGGSTPTPANIANLALTVKVATKGTKGQNLSYAITVKNGSPASDVHQATGVALSFIPAGAAAAGLTYPSLPAGCQAVAGEVTCALPDLAGGQQTTLTITVRPAAIGLLTTTIHETANVIDPNTLNQALTATTNICNIGTTCTAGSGIAYIPVGSGAPGGTVATAQFAQSFDMSNRVASRSRTDFSGTSLSESYSYNLQTGFLVGYANNAGTAKPYAYLPTTGAVTAASYSYDLYGNLTQASSSGPAGSISRSYGYVNPGNPFQLGGIQEQRCQGTACSSYSGHYSYDAAGNTTIDGYGRQYTYDAHGLLQSIQRADLQTETFVRDGLGRTVQRSAPWLAGTVYDFGPAQYNAGTQLWQARFVGGTASYVGNSGVVAEQPAFIGIDDVSRQSVNTLTYGYNSGGFVLAADTGYLPYGTATNLQNPGAGYPAGIADSTAYPDAAMGTAAGADVGTGLRILGDYRAYDPVTGRFLQWDSMAPFGQGGLNGYAYAGNDPVNFWDPTGHYRSVKAKRYGPKPLEAHHPGGGGGGGFWDGFLAGFKHGVKSFYMTPYHYAKSFGQNLAHGHWVGALEMGFDMAVESYVQASLGVAGTMVMQEFISMSPSNIFTGKSPVATNGASHRNAYQWGYDLGGEAGSLTATGVVAVATMGVGEVAGSVADMGADAFGGAADADVATDAGNASRTQLENIPERPTGSAARVRGAFAGDNAFADALPADETAASKPVESEAAPQAEEPFAKRAVNWARNTRFGRWVENNRAVNWMVRNLVLPHDPADPMPWESDLTIGERVKASVTVTKEALNESRKFVDHLSSWGGNDNAPSGKGSGLDPKHRSAPGSGGGSQAPFSLPQTPQPDLLGFGAGLGPVRRDDN